MPPQNFAPRGYKITRNGQTPAPMIVSSTSVQNPPDHHCWRELFGDSFFGHGTLICAAARVHHHPLIYAGSSNFSRMNTVSCRNLANFDLTQCAISAKKTNKKMLALATDLSKSMLLRFCCFQNVPGRPSRNPLLCFKI